MGHLIDTENYDTSGFGHDHAFFKHKLLESGLFTDENLGKLIENYPREFYNVTTMSEVGQKRTWRDGEIGSTRGVDVLEAIKTGRVWLALHHLEKNAPEIKDLLDQCFADLQAANPNFKYGRRNTSLLVSSPTARVHTHADVPMISLWHLRGRKRVWLYDPENKQQLPDDKLESIILHQVEEDKLDYDESWDESGSYFDMEPGDVLSWPMNAPHRVDNLEGLNVSLTSEFFTPFVWRKYGVYFFNGMIRRKLGMEPKSTNTDGLMAYAKCAAALAAKKLGVMNNERFDFISTFQVDPTQPGGYREFEPSDYKKINLA